MVTADRIKEHIARHLKWDASLKGSHIQVGYLGRIAVLTGTVPSLVAHETAQRDAQSIPGVDAVENHLTIKYEHNHPNKSDEQVRSDILTVLGCTADTNPELLKVSVQDGIVTLSGVIDAFWKKARVEDLASSVDGVLDIRNEIRVTPEDRPEDYFIKRDILYALERMEVKGLENLNVDVNGGIVTLSGSVPTWDTAFDVEDTARYTAGVVDVKNKLAVD